MMNLLHCQPCDQDCPSRTAFCKRTCEKWREYESVTRPALYAKRDLERAAAYASVSASRIERDVMKERRRTGKIHY